MDDEEMKKLKFGLYWELMAASVWERYKYLPIISSLAATLLVVATFNNALLPMTSFVKILLTMLLFLIPISLIGYLSALHQCENRARAELGIEIFPGLKGGVMNYFPDIITVVLMLIILFIIILLWM